MDSRVSRWTPRNIGMKTTEPRHLFSSRVGTCGFARLYEEMTENIHHNFRKEKFCQGVVLVSLPFFAH